MKKSALVFTSLFIFASAIPAQTIIENPENPLNKNAGRVIQLKEVMRITDAVANFYFRLPREIGIAQDGSIFVLDRVDKLYKFDSTGKFVKNLLTKGEGPGEINEVMNFLLEEDEIILFDAGVNKIIRFDLLGNLIQEFKLEKKRFYALMAYYKDNYFLVDSKILNYERKSGIKDWGRDLFVVSGKKEIIPTSYSFPGKISVSVSEKKGNLEFLNRLRVAIKDHRFLYINHTQEYLIKLLDLEKKKIEKCFTRKYEKVKAAYQEKSEIPRPEFHNDIQKLLICKDNLWVLTSTIHERKGILTDVFNLEGKYLDSFYLPLLKIKQHPFAFPPVMVIKDNHLYVFEKDIEENFVLVIYEIVD